MVNQNMLLPLLMMGGLNGESNPESGSKEGNPQQTEMLMKLLGLEQEGIVEGVWEDAVVFGTAKDRSNEQTIGVLEVRVTPPVQADPKARIRIKTNGVVLARPEHLQKIADAFARMAKDKGLVEAFEKAQEDEEAVEKEAQTMKMGKALVS